jgi:hypothetical protein
MMSERGLDGRRRSFVKKLELATAGSIVVRRKRSKAYSLACSHRIIGANERTGMKGGGWNYPIDQMQSRE